VAAAFQAIMNKHSVLQTGPQDNSPLQTIINLGGSDAVRLRLSNYAGEPYDNANSHLTGITAVKAQFGLFNLDDGAGKVELQTDTNTLVKGDKRLYAIGAATNGRLGDSF